MIILAILIVCFLHIYISIYPLIKIMVIKYIHLYIQKGIYINFSFTNYEKEIFERGFKRYILLNTKVFNTCKFLKSNGRPNRTYKKI